MHQLGDGLRVGGVLLFQGGDDAVAAGGGVVLGEFPLAGEGGNFQAEADDLLGKAAKERVSGVESPGFGGGTFVEGGLASKQREQFGGVFN